MHKNISYVMKPVKLLKIPMHGSVFLAVKIQAGSRKPQKMNMIT